MPTGTTHAVRLPLAVVEQLDRLANITHRPKTFLAAEAIVSYVTREATIIEGINRGLADTEAGRFVPHDAAMARLEATIAARTSKCRSKLPSLLSRE